MSLDPIISAQVHRPCQKFTFHDAKAFFNLPTIVVYLYYGGDIIFKICTNSIESIINSFLLYQILIDAVDMVLGYFSFETLVLGETAAAAAAVPNNLLQAAAGIVLAVLLEQAVCRVPGLMRPSGKNCT